MPYVQAHQPDHAQTPKPDFRVTYHGTVTTVSPLSDACREWLEENVKIQPWQHFGPSIALEPRYVEHVADAMIKAGLVIEGGDRPAEEQIAHPSVLTTIIIAIALVLALASCGPDRGAAYQRQLEADHQACLNGTTPNACVAYKLDVQKCSVITGNPIAAGCY